MNAFNVIMLASGSKGNASLISCSGGNFLVDVGISCRMLTSRLKNTGCLPEDIDGVFITHEHTDHIKGLAGFLKKYQVPVYSSEKTWRAILAKDNTIDRRFCRIMGAGLQCGGVTVASFSIPHDAADPHGYTFSCGGSKCTYLTDTGFVTAAAREAAEGADTLILEANHDVEMLKNGIYPPALKQRILSTRGHLSNDSAGWMLAQLKKIPEHVILAHLSQDNNRPQLARDTVSNILDSSGKLRGTKIFIASQDHVVTDFQTADNLFSINQNV